MYEIFLGLFLFVALALVGTILLQQGKGADMGASFGSGASNTVFGASGAGNFLTRTTWSLVIVFFIIALVLGYISSHHGKKTDGKSDLFAPETSVPANTAPVSVPAAPVTDIPATPAPAATETEKPASDVPN